MFASASLRIVLVVVLGLLSLSVLIPTGAAASSCPSLSRNLSRGVRGADVVSLQQFLIEEGVLAPGNATGLFGPLTEAAVKSWQASHGVVAFGSPSTTGWGVVGPKTRAAIFASCGRTPALPPVTVQPPVTLSNSCTLDGKIVAHGGSATFYRNRSVQSPVTCASVALSRACTNGTLSGAGDYQFASCTQITQNNPITTPPPTQNPPPTEACVAPTRDLRLGDIDADKGGEVSVLQRFLKRDTAVYPEGLVTGFFGHSTEAAVKRFQKQKNISQTGFVGPLTRAAMKAVCGGGSGTSSTPYKFTATPASGTAPLSVAFSASSVETLTGVTYTVDFGDGSKGDMNQDAQNVLRVSHGYSSGGSFTAKLLQVENICGGGSTSYGCVRELQVDSLSVTVTAPTSGGGTEGGTGGTSGDQYITVSPAHGPAPLAVTATVALICGGGTPNPPYAQCEAVTLNWGDGTVETIPKESPGYAGSKVKQHTYASPGTYNITAVSNAFNYNYTGRATVTVTAGGGGGGGSGSGGSCVYNGAVYPEGGTVTTGGCPPCGAYGCPAGMCTVPVTHRCSGGQWSPTLPGGVVGGSCRVPRKCGDIIVPNGAGVSGFCGPVCMRLLCSNGNLIQGGTCNVHGSCEYSISCPGDPQYL